MRYNDRVPVPLVLAVVVALVATACHGDDPAVRSSPAPRASPGSWLAVVFDPTGGPIWRVDPRTGAKRVLVENAEASDLAWSPDGTVLIFDYHDPQQDRRVLRAVDASGRRLPHAIPGVGQASFAPDGRRIVFQACLAFCLATATLDGRDVELLLRCRCLAYDPAWSPSGDRIAYVRQRDYSEGAAILRTTTTITLRSLDKNERPLVGEGEEGDECESQGEPAWSPDGAQIAYSCGLDEIWISDVDGQRPRLLTEGQTFAWSPDGHAIAFSREIAEGERAILGLVDPQTGEVRTIARGEPIYSIAWRP